jgi:hypothetical protein
VTGASAGALVTDPEDFMKLTRLRNPLVVLFLALGISACSQAVDLGVTRVTQLAVDVAALPADLPPHGLAAMKETRWYERHPSFAGVCRPFLVVEGPTGTTADFYADTRC